MIGENNSLETDDTLPEWYDGKHIHEVLFCRAFLKKHPMKCVRGRLFTVDGLIEDEAQIGNLILDEIAGCLTTGLSKAVANLLASIKLQAYSPPLPMEADRIHVANGTYFMDGHFSAEKSYCNNRLRVAYDPNAAQPVRWLRFLSELLYAEDIPTLQEFMGYCLLPVTKGQKMLLMIGKGGEGKSRIGLVMRALLGDSMNTTSIQKVESNRFSRADLENKLLILAPLIVRPLEYSDKYEIVSGHRRFRAAQKAGFTEVPAIIYALDHDEAAIALVDSNLHREHLLPSEKAFAYRLKLEALNHQGKATSRQVVGKLESADFVSETESGRQVQRYIRLTNLIPALLDMVDEERIAFTPAVELSYLADMEQYALLDEIRAHDCTPSLAQAQRLKRESQSCGLSADFIAGVMSEEKANQKERVRIPTERIRKYFPRDYTTTQMEEAIIKLCEANYRKRQQSRDAR